MSTSPSPPTPEHDSEDPFSYLTAAMHAPSSPIEPSPGPPRKRKRTDGHDSDSGQDDEETQPADAGRTPVAANIGRTRNVTEKILRYAAKKKLRPEQLPDIEKFVRDSEAVQRAKLYVEVLAVQNMVENIVTVQPPYTVTKDLKTNIDAYAWGVLLSTSLRTYKGAAPKEHLTDILKRLRFDLPPGIENNAANWGKVTTQVESALTQVRSSIKKALRNSVNQSSKKNGKTEYDRMPSSKAQNIYDLTQQLVSKTRLTASAPLCARIALMRAIWIADSSDHFWNSLDTQLVKLYQAADNDERKVRKAFEKQLTLDRRTYGTDNGYTIPTIGTDFQQRCDDLINNTFANRSTADAESPDDASSSLSPAA
ncbi:hypothetical protein PQX77_021584 [Marasmius sp. AFHP31]|nr:hypothetical protein PQX77_021584 [Marasmius sp. AFHP31]